MQPSETRSIDPREANASANKRYPSHGSASGSPDATQTTTQAMAGTMPSTTIPSPMAMQPMLTPGGFDRRFVAPLTPLMNWNAFNSGYVPVPSSTPMSFGFGQPPTIMQQPVPPTYQALLQPISSMTTQYPVGDVSNGFGFDMPFSLPSAGTSGITPIHHSPFAHLPMATPSSTPAAVPYIPRSPAPTTAPTKEATRHGGAS